MMPFYKPHPLKSTWNSIKQRCHNPNNRFYDIYGGRGIKVCDRWRYNFDYFLADMGEKPDGHSLDRINPNGNYEPDNCRWATPIEQSRNTRRTRKITIEGVEYIASELAQELNIKTDTLINRVNKGMSKEDIFSGKRLDIYKISQHTRKANYASKLQKSSQTHCKHGHEYTDENTAITPQGHRNCKTCRRERAAGRRKKIMKKPNHCINGHEYTEENTWYNTKGYRLCRICKLASIKRSREKKKLTG